MLYIRTDANEIIATGHVMRCLTIAEEFRKKKETVCFVVSDETSATMIEKKGFAVIVTNEKWNAVDTEREYTILKLCAETGGWLLIDSYFINSEYITQMKQIFKVAVFDDMFSEKKNADLIINYNVFYRKFDYKNRYKNEACTLLLGEKYVPLRQQFQQIKPELAVRKYRYPKVLLMCGGADKPNLICGVLQYLKDNNLKLLSEIDWKIVIGSYYSNYHRLEQLIQENSNIELLCDVENMAELMYECDLCVTAASTVLYECCAMLLPTIFFVVAEDQKYDAEFFSKNNMMLYCGNFMDCQEAAIKKMETELVKIIYDRKKQYHMKKMMKNFVDAKGAERIAVALIGERC